MTLLLSPSLRQSGELFRKCLAIYRCLDQAIKRESESALRIELANGSRIVSLPGTESTVRGFSGVAPLVVDEASRVEDPLYYSVRPMLATSGGRLLALSTPFGTRGWWYEAWVSRDDWERYEVPASDCPRISAAFLEEEERTLGAFWFTQEYRCQFIDAQSAAFRRVDIDRAVSAEVQRWHVI